MFRGTFEIAKMVAIIGKFENNCHKVALFDKKFIEKPKNDLEALFDLC